MSKRVQRASLKIAPRSVTGNGCFGQTRHFRPMYYPCSWSRGRIMVDYAGHVRTWASEINRVDYVVVGVDIVTLVMEEDIDPDLESSLQIELDLFNNHF